MTGATSTSERVRSRRMVVGTDGSSGGETALRWAHDHAVLLSAELEVVVAWDVIAKWAIGVDPQWPADADHLASDATTAGDASVTAALEGRSRPDWLSVHAIQGPPALVLTERARGADLLVVGSRGRGGFSRLMLGSVSSACVKHATCPTVVIPAGTATVD